MMDQKHLGAVSELRACSYLLEQGYEVFRNVSQFGLIDIVALKDGQITYFDVKTIGVKTDGRPSSPTLTPAQHMMGVKLLGIMPDGSVREDIQPARRPEEMQCLKCGEAFLPRKGRQQFCSVSCRSVRYRAARLATTSSSPSSTPHAASSRPDFTSKMKDAAT